MWYCFVFLSLQNIKHCSRAGLEKPYYVGLQRDFKKDKAEKEKKTKQQNQPDLTP